MEDRCKDPDMQCLEIIPEAASVVEPPISQVPLHKVNVFATDPTDAADGAACSSQSLQGRVRSC